MKKLMYVLPAILFLGCGDKEEDTGDTASEAAEEDTSAEDTE